MKILISACLCGLGCRYDGKSIYYEKLDQLNQAYTLIPVCPEILGGLPTPRPPAEIQHHRVMTCLGTDVTPQYKKGAEETLKIAKMLHCSCAVLKERSPSCGCGKIYDGTFSKTLKSGDGITAGILKQAGIKIFGESQIDEVLKENE